MKALFIITGLFPGGAERIVLELVRGLREAGRQAAVVSLQGEPPPDSHVIVDQLEALGVRPYFLDLSVRRPWRILELKKILLRESPDLVHSHLMHANLTARIFCGNRRFPLINTIHIAERRRSLKIKLLFLLDRLTIRRCDLYTAVSRAAAEFHERRCRLPHETIRVIYNGSDPVIPKTAPEIAAAKEKWGLSNAARIIGSIGRLDHQKGYDIFLRSLPQIRKLIPPGGQWGILLIGDGPEREKLRRLAADAERDDPRLHIVLPGFLPDAAAWLPVLDLFVMPSRYEGFGLALTEALSLGIPSLCSQADSLPELCAFSPENTLCADFSAADLTETYRAALKLPKLPGKVFRTSAEMTAEYLNLYREILQKKSASMI